MRTYLNDQPAYSPKRKCCFRARVEKVFIETPLPVTSSRGHMTIPPSLTDSLSFTQQYNAQPALSLRNWSHMNRTWIFDKMNQSSSKATTQLTAVNHRSCLIPVRESMHSLFSVGASSLECTSESHVLSPSLLCTDQRIAYQSVAH